MMVSFNRYDHRPSLEFAKSWQANRLLPAHLLLKKKVPGKDMMHCSQISTEDRILLEVE